MACAERREGLGWAVPGAYNCFKWPGFRADRGTIAGRIKSAREESFGRTGSRFKRSREPPPPSPLLLWRKIHRHKRRGNLSPFLLSDGSCREEGGVGVGGSGSLQLFQMARIPSGSRNYSGRIKSAREESFGRT